MTNNIVTLQLTVPALEKLFEGDPQFALSLKQAAISEFARRKIGDLLTKSAKADIDHAVAQQVGSMKSTGYGQPQIQLQEPILQGIRAETQKTMDAHKKAIDKMIQEIADTTIQAQIEEIDQKVKREVERRVTAEISARVTAEVKSRMADVLKAAQL